MKNSKIEWCDATFNPWVGCTKVSEGCKNCYAEELMDKRYNKVKWGPQGLRVRTSAANWKQPLKWNREAEKAGKRARVFCASLADVFEDKPDQPEMDEWREDLCWLIFETPHLDWLLLTKRPENVLRMMPYIWSFPDMAHLQHGNVWIGTSVETQEQADIRIPELLKIPAGIRFLSCEPLLGPVNLSPCMVFEGQYEKAEWMLHKYGSSQPLSWVIVGGESGRNARPMHPDWVRSLRDQCQEAGVPFLFKQWGGYAPDCLCATDKPHVMVLRPEPGKPGGMFKCGKHAAGRLLDGREWNEFPIPRAVKEGETGQMKLFEE